VFVHLFEWPWPDIAQECEQVLGPAGYSAVQVSPPAEHAKIVGRPWWERYQPVSYELVSRSGTREEFVDMVERCAAVGVDVYVDAVLNHMSAQANGEGTAGTRYTKYNFPDWTPEDFHSPTCDIQGTDYAQSATAVRECELLGLADLNTGAAHVREGLADHIPAHLLSRLREEVEMARELLPAFDLAEVRDGHLTPIWFGSALNSFGVRDLMTGIGRYAPPPQPRRTATRQVGAEEKPVTGFVFKVQANMDPKHRDRVAFVRLCSGHFTRGMKLHHVRAAKPMAISNPVLFLAAERELAEDAWAGDIIGIPNHGQLRIGDALTEGETLHFTGIPAFAPELLQNVRAGDPMKAKHLDKALTQFAEEGAAKLFKPQVGSGWIVGVVGPLQFDVLASRIELEYGLPVRFEPTQFTSARWVSGSRDGIEAFARANNGHMAEDHDGDPVYMTRLQWDIDRVARDWPEVRLTATKETMA
jgi:hypothetical protein